MFMDEDEQAIQSQQTDRSTWVKHRQNSVLQNQKKVINSNYNQLRICIFIQNSQIIFHFSAMSYWACYTKQPMSLTALNKNQKH